MKNNFLIFVLCLFTINSSAKDYYVNVTGSDTNVGSNSSPWASVYKAITSVGAGDVIHVGAGIFTETNFLKVPAGVSIIGAGSKETTILVNKYYDLEKHFVYCDGTREGWAPAVDQFCLQIAKGDNQTFKGFKMSGQKRSCHGAIYMEYGKNVVFDDLNIQDFKFTGLWVYTSAECEIKYCYLKDNCYGNANNDAGNIMFHANTNLLIHDNVILETGIMNGKGGYGIKTYSKLFVNACFWTSWDANWNAWAIGTKIYNNTITVPELGTWLAGTNSVPDITIEFNGLSAKNCEIFNNTLNNHISLIGIKGNGYDFQSFNVHHNFINLGTRYSYACEVDAQGLTFHHNYIFGGYYPLAQWGNNETVNNLQVHHNVFDSPRGGQPLVLTDHSIFKDFKFYNNTVIDVNGLSQIFKPGNGSFSNVDIRNNLFIATTARGDIFPTTKILGKIEYNGFQNITAKGTNSIAGDMKLNMEGNKPTPFATLQSTSTAINAGVEIPNFTNDSTTAPDLGAFEYNGVLWSCGAGKDTLSPAAPLNLATKKLGASSLILTWNAATDNVAVATYSIFKDGLQIATSATNFITVNDLVALTSYTFSIVAIDYSGNNSEHSKTFTVTTLEKDNNQKLLIEAEKYSEMKGITDKTTAIGGCDNGDYAAYYNVDFNPGYTLLTVKAAVIAGYAGQTAEFRLDSINGTLLATIVVASSGSWTKFVDNVVEIQPIIGNRNLYVVFKSTFMGVGDFDFYSFSEATFETSVVAQKKYSNFDFNIVPNPVINEQFLIHIPGNNQVVGIKIIDLQGKNVLTTEFFRNDKMLINSQGKLHKGVYLVQAIGAKSYKTQKLIIH